MGGFLLGDAVKFTKTLLILFLLATACSQKKGSIMLGSDLSQGVITDTSLAYTFPVYRGTARNHALFNHMYFRGDTLCFSLCLRNQINPQHTRARLIPGNSKRSYPFERIDYHGTCISGFSLVGTIMEQWYADRLKLAPPEHHYSGKKHGFTVIVRIKKRVYRRSGFFTIGYRGE